MQELIEPIEIEGFLSIQTNSKLLEFQTITV